jgi:LuxR family transcriptional regulator, maltose regulon positive regulatory protein
VSVLRAELRRRLGDELPALHGAAGAWFARHAQPLEAVRHAVAASDWRLAAEVIGTEWLVCVVHGSGAKLRELASDLPASVVDADAELALAIAGLLLEAGEIERADELLVRAYELADQLPPERRRRFTVTCTATALYRARLEGNVAEALSAAHLALDERWDRSVAVEVRALTLANLGIAEFWANDHEDALDNLHAAAGLALEYGNDFVLFIAESYLAAVDARQGRLSDARGHARTAIQLGERRGWTDLPHMAIAYAALATVHLWWNELDEAERASELARDALGRSPEPMLPPVVAQIRARIHALRGDPVTALEVLRGGGSDRALPPWLSVTNAMIEAELWLSLGEPARARRSLEAISSIDVSDPAITLARLELALGEPDEALRAIAGFLADAREPVMPTSRTEAWAVDAMARDAIHDESGALRAIERALDLAEPRGYSDPIIRHGAPVRSLLRRRIARGTAHRAFAGELLAVLEQEPAARRSNGDPLLEPLSDRELAVLRFLPTMMSNAEIAGEMFVSVNTVKTHLKHIYRKLDVSERRDAVRRGRELHLLSPGLTDS